jgi:hypothetical protein
MKEPMLVSQARRDPKKGRVAYIPDEKDSAAVVFSAADFLQEYDEAIAAARRPNVKFDSKIHQAPPPPNPKFGDVWDSADGEKVFNGKEWVDA